MLINNSSLCKKSYSKKQYPITPFHREVKEYDFNLLTNILFVLILGSCLSSCKKMVEVNDPITGINNTIVYGNDANATSVLTGIYTKISQDGINGNIGSLSFIAGLSADELVLNSGNTNLSLLGYYQNNLTSSTTGTFDYWNQCYPVIYIANSAIEGVSASNALTPSVKKELLGEAKFIRAFYYFYLVNLYGDVPLVLTTDYTTNSKLHRIAAAQIYQQIVSDFSDAKQLLSENYVDAHLSITPDERVSPTKWAASAMLSRTYLYMGDYQKAESEASLLIDNTSLFDTVAVNDVFLRTSKEAIWQIQPVGSFITNTTDARLFILPAGGPNITNYPVYLRDKLVNSFEPGDKRFSNWIKSVSVGGTVYPYAYKYKVKAFSAPVTEYTMVLRLAEQYLIRAEARAQLNDNAGSIADLDVIRTRAGLNNYSEATDKESLLNAINHERQLEFFSEWGQRWLDLKRSGKADEVLPLIKGANWQSTDKLYPIPQSEINKNPSLKGQQNPGYN